MVCDLRDRLIEQGMSINLTDATCNFIAEEGTDVTYGARPLRRAIQRILEDPISEQVLEGKWKPGDIIEADYNGDDVVFTKGTGDIPEPRKRQSIAREAELITPIFGGRGGAKGGSGTGSSGGELSSS
ncbi:MAG: NDP-hexose 4-ketoreductase, partial [Coriobacteriales bacterium]|jgi:ATP-dependent Clp protease ATP-binding subunit ClpC|nr:NDP-hexose 4-ketoreductase [Coriobacteriales bacterium]